MSKIFADGHVLGARYEIRHFLDAGGMQEVYVSQDTLLNRLVALKTPFNNSAEKRFQRSAELAARINHPNVAKTMDFFVENGRQILVEELVVGKSVEKQLTEDYAHFDPHLLARFGHHFSKAIQASHHVDVVHRDLKPSNIMVETIGAECCFKVTDFGIARLVESELEGAVDDEGSIGTAGSSTIVGALPYMAPELIENPKTSDKPADIWAFGAILYRLLSGATPYGTGLAAVPKIYAAEPPNKPIHIDRVLQFKSLANELWNVSLSCLKKNPEERPTASELAERFASLTYATGPRKTGSVQSFRPKGHPWGMLSDGSKSYFFHQDSFYGDPSTIAIGLPVEWCSYPGGKLDRAHPVVPIKPQK